MADFKREYLIGHSYDIHRLNDFGDKIILGNIVIPTENLSVIAHSDGDCLLHSLAESILSALGMEDLGTYFPENSLKTKNMNSLEIIEFALENMKKRKYQINNVTILISLEKPKLKEYKKFIKNRISEILDVDIAYVSVLAGTEEGLGEIGHSKAIKVTSTVLLKKE